MAAALDPTAGSWVAPASRRLPVDQDTRGPTHPGADALPGHAPAGDGAVALFHLPHFDQCQSQPPTTRSTVRRGQRAEPGRRQASGGTRMGGFKRSAQRLRWVDENLVDLQGRTLMTAHLTVEQRQLARRLSARGLSLREI